MENDNNPRTNSHDDEQLVSETSLGRNSEKKADPGKQKHDLFFLLLPISTCRGWLGGGGSDR